MKRISALLAVLALLCAIALPVSAENFGQVQTYARSEELPLEKYLTEENLSRYDFDFTNYFWGQIWMHSEGDVDEMPERFPEGVHAEDPFVNQFSVRDILGRTMIFHSFPAWFTLTDSSGTIQSPAMNLQTHIDEEGFAADLSNIFYPYGYCCVTAQILEQEDIDDYLEWYSLPLDEIPDWTNPQHLGSYCCPNMEPTCYEGWDYAVTKKEIAGCTAYEVDVFADGDSSPVEMQETGMYYVITDEPFEGKYQVLMLEFHGLGWDYRYEELDWKEATRQQFAENITRIFLDNTWYEAALYETTGAPLPLGGTPAAQKPTGGGYMEPNQPQQDPAPLPGDPDPFYSDHGNSGQGDSSGGFAKEAAGAVIPAAAAVAGTVILAGAGKAAAGAAGVKDLFKGDSSVRTDADGTIWIEDPPTKTVNTYNPNKDGTYTNPITGATYTPEELKEQLDSRRRNEATLRQDHQFAEQATWEQRRQNQQRDQYLKKFQDTQSRQRAAWEEQHQKEVYQRKVAWDLGMSSSSSQEEIEAALKKRQAFDQEQAESYKAAADSADTFAFAAEAVKHGADTVMDTAAGMLGGQGKAIKAAYTVATGAAEGFGTAFAEGKDLSEGTLRGAAKGTVSAVVDTIDVTSAATLLTKAGANGAGNAINSYIDFAAADEKDFLDMTPAEQKKRMETYRDKFFSGVTQTVFDSLVDMAAGGGSAGDPKSLGDAVTSGFTDDLSENALKKGISIGNSKIIDMAYNPPQDPDLG